MESGHVSEPRLLSVHQRDGPMPRAKNDFGLPTVEDGESIFKTDSEPTYHTRFMLTLLRTLVLSQVSVPNSSAKISNNPVADRSSLDHHRRAVSERTLVEGVCNELANRMARGPPFKNFLNVQVKVA